MVGDFVCSCWVGGVGNVRTEELFRASLHNLMILLFENFQSGDSLDL